MKYSFPLIRNNVSREDLDLVIDYLKQDNPILTQSKNVKLFEQKWSKWLGVKYSVFVNSGSSANLITMSVLKILFPEGGNIIVPPLTWVSDISSVIQSGFTPIFSDINLDTLSMDTEKILNKIDKDTKAVFLSHIQGFSGLTEKLLNELKRKKILLIEDVCESHGAKHKNKKLGTFGLISNFSFYYAHHMSTIEGGMICTNDNKVYQIARMLRSHGMIRESSEKKLIASYKNKFEDLNSDFIFSYCAYNMRNNEIGGIIGLSQLPRLNRNIILRNRNHKLFLSQINSKKFKTDFKLEGSSNYAFNLILKEPDGVFFDKICKNLNEQKIEFRRGSAGGGNQLRQPYLRNKFKDKFFLEFPNAEHVHFFGLYIGNYPNLSKNDIKYICSIINGI